MGRKKEKALLSVDFISSISVLKGERKKGRQRHFHTYHTNQEREGKKRKGGEFTLQAKGEETTFVFSTLSRPTSKRKRKELRNANHPVSLNSYGRRKKEEANNPKKGEPLVRTHP